MTCYICHDKNNILTITNSIDVKIFTDSVSLCIVDMIFPDKLTLKLCVNCYDSLTAFNRFRQLCIRNEDYMKDIFKVKPKKKRKLNGSDEFSSIKKEPGTQSSKKESTSSEPAPKLKKAKKRKSENEDEGKPTKKLKKIKVKNEPVDPPLKKAKNKKKVKKTLKKKSEEFDDASAKCEQKLKENVKKKEQKANVKKNERKANVKKNERKANLKNGENRKNKKNLESKKKHSSKKKNDREDQKIEIYSRIENVFEDREGGTNLKSENVTTDKPNENYYQSSSSNNVLHVCEKCNKIAFKLQDLRQHVIAKHYRDLDYLNRLMRDNFSSYGRLSPGRTSRSTTYNHNSIERDINNYKEMNHGESRRERNSESTEEHNSSEQPHSNEDHYSNSERYNEVNDQTDFLQFNSVTIKKENLGSDNTDEQYDALKYTIFEEDPDDLSVMTESHCYGENEKQDSSIVNTEVEYIDLV